MRKKGSEATPIAIIQEKSRLYKQDMVENLMVGLMEKMIAMYRSMVRRTDDKAAVNCPKHHRNPRNGHR